LPELEALRREYQSKGVDFLALSLEPDEQSVIAFAQSLNLEMPVAIAQGEMLGPLGVNQVPSLVFVARDGTIVAAASGVRKPAFVRKRIEELLRK
jgi:hypothetical protein